MDRKLIIPSFEGHIENYIDSEINLLSDLKKNLLALKNQLPNNIEIKAIIFELGLDIREYTRQKEEDWQGLHTKADFSQYPSLWSDTTRCFSTTIVEEIKENNLYQAINNCLDINVNNKEIRSLIHAAKKEHEQNRIKFKLDFLTRAKNFKARKLKKRLSHLNFDLKLERQLKKELHLIIHLDEAKLQTRGDCVVWHKRISDLEKKISENCKKSDAEEKQKLKVIHQIKDISILTKRFLDHYYENPPALSNSDKVRKGTKFLSLVIGLVFSATALALLFTPAAPLAPFLGFVGIVGFYPLLDTIGEVIKNIIFYHRAPTKSQVIQMTIGITIVLILSAVLPGLIAAVPAIGSISGPMGAKVCGVISKICNDINVFGMKSFGILANSGKFLSAAWGTIKSSFQSIVKKSPETPPLSVPKITFPRSKKGDNVESESQDKKQFHTPKEKSKQLKSGQETDKTNHSSRHLTQRSSVQEFSPVGGVDLSKSHAQNNINPTFETKSTPSLLFDTNPIPKPFNLPAQPAPGKDDLPSSLAPPKVYNITAQTSAKQQTEKKSASWNPSLFSVEKANSADEIGTNKPEESSKQSGEIAREKRHEL